MRAEQLRELENDLWEAADQLRANSKLTATEYTMPVLGLIFLRQASTRFDQVKRDLEPSLVLPNGRRMPLTKELFQERSTIFIPEHAHYDYLVNLPNGTDIGDAIDKAMRLIEEQYDQLTGVLPKTYTLFEKELLASILRIFNKEALRNATGDVFGKIYEYFLNEFAKKGAQEGGEFFTPMSLVQTIVNFIEPDHGIVFDPACGSAGMFVQSGYFIERQKKNVSKAVTFFGQEKTGTNTNIAKMNMAVHGLEGFIMEGNSFYEDKHALVGQCDFVMANPPFNVDKVDKDRDVVKNDPRLPFGLPKADNANYLWIQYFYSYLNEKGRAGFVMSSSASDASHSEKQIREQIVKTGAVDIMVAIGNNFFYTRTLPCTLWFFDRSKEKDPVRADQILMLDARKIFRKVTTTINDFSPEQLDSLTAIVKAYRGDNTMLQKLPAIYVGRYAALLSPLEKQVKELVALNQSLTHSVEHYSNTHVVSAYRKFMTESEGFASGAVSFAEALAEQQADLNAASTYEAIREVDAAFAANKGLRRELRKHIDSMVKLQSTALSALNMEFELGKVKAWKDLKTKALLDDLEASKQQLHSLLHEIEYYHHASDWLLKRFPGGVYLDVEGLTRVVSRSDVGDRDFSLSPGRFVGVANSADEDGDYAEQLDQIHQELELLNLEAAGLATVIFESYKTVTL